MAFSDHLSAEMLEGYHQRALKPAHLLEVDDHVAICGMCREMLRGSRPRDRALFALRASIDPTLGSKTGHPGS